MAQRIGGFEIERRVGWGAFGDVYRARSRSGRPVALKLLREAGSGPGRETFATELAMRHLSHPHLVVATDGGEHDERPFLVFPWLGGMNLRQLQYERERSATSVEISRAVSIVADISSALAYLEASSVVHRDVSPSNVMIGSDGVARLIDFGVAAEEGTVDGRFVGRLGYTPAEQMMSDPVAPALDVYALGVILFELVTGLRAFHTKALSFSGILRRKLTGPLAPPFDLPPVLRTLIQACTDPDASRRPSAARVGRLLAPLLDPEPAPLSLTVPPAIMDADTSKMTREDTRTIRVDTADHGSFPCAVRPRCSARNQGLTTITSPGR